MQSLGHLECHSKSSLIGNAGILTEMSNCKLTHRTNKQYVTSLMKVQFYYLYSNYNRTFGPIVCLYLTITEKSFDHRELYYAVIIVTKFFPAYKLGVNIFAKYNLFKIKKKLKLHSLHLLP